MYSVIMLEIGWSKTRQGRLLAQMAAQRLDAVVIGLSPHVYYFTAYLPHWLHQAGWVIFADGRSALVCAHDTATAAADEVIPYEHNWMSTLRQEQPSEVAKFLVDKLDGAGAKRLGFDASAVSSQVLSMLQADAVPVDPVLWQLRRVKDPDELALLSVAARACDAMYATAREIVVPGVLELEVFSRLHEAAVRSTGEPMTALLGNDFACAAGGGPPRKDCVAAAGELYILDLGPTYRGYFSDTCRTFAVDRKPTDAQVRAHEVVIGALKVVEDLARPGVRCRDIFDAVDAHMRQSGGSGMGHHLGHGVGLQPHEYPHLNPKWDDTLLEGEVFTAEPGVYSPGLRAGIRIENEYVVTGDGLRTLNQSPLTL